MEVACGLLTTYVNWCTLVRSVYKVKYTDDLYSTDVKPELDSTDKQVANRWKDQ